MRIFKGFGETAKGLATNPLGIIALFLVLVYGFACLVLGFNTNLQSSERLIIVWFLVIFPVVVLGVFVWLVSCHHEKLYAPKDYSSDKSFLQGLTIRAKHRPDLRNLDQQIEEKIRETLTSESLLDALRDSKTDLKEKMEGAARAASQEIRSTSFITISISRIADMDDAAYDFPISVFPSLAALLDEVYFLLEQHVGMYSYGYDWVLRNQTTGTFIQNTRMLTKAGPGKPCPDPRSLEEVGIAPGNILEVIKL